jgi:D-alanyl-lipoteichoic acid acyltransferase DltB (MBOAT superfamily)
MTFTSPLFFIFLAVVFLFYYFSKDSFRWIVLLFASYCFYASFRAPELLVALALVTGISYLCGLWLGLSLNRNRRTMIFWLGTFGCLAILVIVKYLPITAVFAFGRTSQLISIGISYFTFQAISYLADVYLEIQEPEKQLKYHALSLAFFPKLLQGPIERAGDLIPQLKKKYEFDYDAMRSGLLLITWGLLKKIVIADRMALYANQVYRDVHSYSGLPLLMATYAYALQIYFDFSGYTDIARGIARMFGINLTENFNSPYLATSIADFWRRWHISFSRWILDYIFKPLQMCWRDWGQVGTSLALIITFLVSGIWHGANWGFVVWGLLHGAFLAVSTYYRPYQKKLHKMMGLEKSRWLKWWQVFVTFNLVSFAWIFFRTDSIGDAWYVVKNIWNLYDSYVLAHAMGVHEFVKINVWMGQGESRLYSSLAILAVVFIAFKFRRIEIITKPLWFRWLLYYSMIISLIWLTSGNSEFIYFKF